MLGHIVHKAYYGSFSDYFASPRKAILFFTSFTNNVDDVKCLNEPVLDWEVGKAGNVTFLLPPYNSGYSAIKCKQQHIFVERNGELIWHGRAITDSYDLDLRREIVCEGSLNYLLDTTIKPENAPKIASYRQLFDNLVDCHNRALSAGDSIILGTSGWKTSGSNASIEMNDASILFNFNNSGSGSLQVLSSPSLRQYKNNVGRKVRVSFKVTKFGTGNATLTYGLHLSISQIVGDISSMPTVNGAGISESTDVSFITYLGPGGLDGTGHENAYIGFHMYANGPYGTSFRVEDLKVEFYFDYRESIDKLFPKDEGQRSGIDRIPFASTSGAKAIDIRDYPTTLDAINDIFVNPYGGYLFVNYAEDEGVNSYHPVLNYIYGNSEKDDIPDNLPEIRSGKNLISFKETTNYENYPTVLVPLGRRKEEWERTVLVTTATYTASKSIDKDGNVINATDARHYVAELPVKEGEVYYISGQGVNELGLYSIVNSSGKILENKTFSNSDGNWYQHVGIEVPNDASTLRVFFYNSSRTNPPTTSIFKLQKFTEEDKEDYITLDGYLGSRTDEFAGTRYVPIGEETDIYTYGWIEQIVHFDDAEDQATLWALAAFYLNFFEEALKTYEAEAVELAPISDDSDYIPIGTPGTYANVIVPSLSIAKQLCVTKCSINLRTPNKSTYSLANLPPPDLSDLIVKGLYI